MSDETYDGPSILFGGHNLLPTGKFFQRTTDAVVSRLRNREEWYAKRRQQLKERTRATVIDRVLKKRTQQCAAKRSGDPSLAVGRRLQAKAHAEARKAGVVEVGAMPLARARLPSVSAIPGVSELRSMSSKEGLINFAELQTDKIPRWYHKGKYYPYEELRVCLNREKQLRQNSENRKESRRNLKKFMEQLQTNLRESVALRAKGITAIPEFQLLQTQKTTLKPRQVSVHEWNLKMWAGRLGKLDADKRRPSVQVNSFPQVSNFAVPDTGANDEDAMDMDWNKVVIEVDDAKFEMPTIQDFNATRQDNLESTLKSMSLILLKNLKDHLKAERPKTGVGADQPKWNALVNAISEKHQSGGKKNGHGSGNGHNGNNNQLNNSNDSNDSNNSNHNKKGHNKKGHNNDKSNNNDQHQNHNNSKNFNTGNNNNRNNNFNSGSNNNNQHNNNQNNPNFRKKKWSNGPKPTREQLQANRKQGHANLQKELQKKFGKK